tara:strand:+ start:548 stop:817 length:270 start_codon:yes stop_codon:yes gene_type:complete
VATVCPALVPHFIKIGHVGDTLGINSSVLVPVLKVTVAAAATVKVLRAAVPELRLGVVLFNGANHCPITIGSTSGDLFDMIKRKGIKYY